jgi:hypothetical protein
MLKKLILIIELIGKIGPRLSSNLILIRTIKLKDNNENNFYKINKAFL